MTVRKRIREFLKENGVSLDLASCDKFNKLADALGSNKSLFEYSVIKAITIEEILKQFDENVDMKKARKTKDFMDCINNIEKEPSEFLEYRNGLIKLLRETYLWSAMIYDTMEKECKKND